MLRRLRFICLFLVQFHSCFGDVFTITAANRTVLDNYKVALLQFSAEWCPFSQQLTPIFSEASNNFLEETKKADVLFGRVNCVESADLCSLEKIDKYPTIKVLRYGITMRKEYRGVRTVDALTQFTKEHLMDNVRILDGEQKPHLQAVNDITVSSNSIIGLFPTLDLSNVHLQYFKRASHMERDNCNFYILHNFTEPVDRLAYKEPLSQRVKEITKLSGADFRAIHSWIQQKCTPVVRELTFANAEEITDEGYPLLILFYDSASSKMKIVFDELVRKHFTDELGQINFLTADGAQFSHPLRHLGKTVQDLPLLCIDSLRHIYGHPGRPEDILRDPVYLRNFIADLRSGKLHQEFHFGRTVDTTPQTRPSGNEDPSSHDSQPKESVFKRLRSSYMKYTLLHDEL